MKKVFSLLLVLMMSFGMILSVHATENDNNLQGQTYRIIDESGNVIAQTRLSISNPTVPVGCGIEWDVNVVKGSNSMSVSVTPSAKLKLEVTNSVGVSQYTYTTGSTVSSVYTSYNSSAAGRGRYRVWNKSSSDITVTKAAFNGN